MGKKSKRPYRLKAKEIRKNENSQSEPDQQETQTQGSALNISINTSNLQSMIDAIDKFEGNGALIISGDDESPLNLSNGSAIKSKHTSNPTNAAIDLKGSRNIGELLQTVNLDDDDNKMYATSIINEVTFDQDAGSQKLSDISSYVEEFSVESADSYQEKLEQQRKKGGGFLGRFLG